MKKIIFIISLLLLATYTHAANNQEVPLDSAVNYQGNTVIDTTDANQQQGSFMQTARITAIKTGSFLLNTFSTQGANKDAAQNQNIDLEAAKNNLDNSKQNVSMMFFFIVNTFVVLFDLILSLVYILLMVVVLWIIFIGYAKIMIAIIDFIHGRITIYKEKKA